MFRRKSTTIEELYNKCVKADVVEDVFEKEKDNSRGIYTQDARLITIVTNNTIETRVDNMKKNYNSKRKRAVVN